MMLFACVYCVQESNLLVPVVTQRKTSAILLPERKLSHVAEVAEKKQEGMLVLGQVSASPSP